MVKEVSPFEKALHLPALKWDGSTESFKELKKIRKIINSIYLRLNTKGSANFTLNENKYNFVLGKNYLNLNDKKYLARDEEKRPIEDVLGEIRGLYGQIFEKQLSKEKNDRGNSESAVVINSAAFVKDVFKPQFARDWNFSVSQYMKQNEKKAEYIPPSRFDAEG